MPPGAGAHGEARGDVAAGRVADQAGAAGWLSVIALIGS